MVGICWSPECRTPHERKGAPSQCDTRRALRATYRRAGQPVPPPPAADPNSLTRREREVAALVAKGLSNRKIAAEPLVPPHTVDFHVEDIRAELGFGSRTQVAVRWAGQERPTS
ncbi:helix-turn-helix transcriptional regulator [Streptomyces sp. NPDC005921]|uniref:response regulator transcription factor n=1 Tax=Streptomyces sp. NPDC005827 TaxID=3157070 RepID=UPI00340EDEF0